MLFKLQLKELIQRFLAVVFPVSSLGYRTITNAKVEKLNSWSLVVNRICVKVAIFLTWMIPIVCAVPVWWAHGLATMQSRKFFKDSLPYSLKTLLDAYCYFDRTNYSFTGFHVGFFLTSFALPTVLITIMYIVMLLSLWKSSTFTASK